MCVFKTESNKCLIPEDKKEKKALCFLSLPPLFSLFGQCAGIYIYCPPCLTLTKVET